MVFSFTNNLVSLAYILSLKAKNNTSPYLFDDFYRCLSKNGGSIDLKIVYKKRKIKLFVD